MTQRLTMKLSGGGLLVEHLDVDGTVTEQQFRAAAKSVAERLGKKAASRPGASTRKHTAARAEVEVDV